MKFNIKYLDEEKVASNTEYIISLEIKKEIMVYFFIK